MNKIIIGIVVVLALGVAGYFFLKPEIVQAPQPETSGNDQICAQVITPARNPATGEIQEFPTPCDVPEGWQEIQNEVPALDDYQPQ